jgi:hypothetical protein
MIKRRLPPQSFACRPGHPARRRYYGGKNHFPSEFSAGRPHHPLVLLCRVRVGCMPKYRVCPKRTPLSELDLDVVRAAVIECPAPLGTHRPVEVTPAFAQGPILDDGLASGK